jgi:segregation and condensation protein B
MSAADLSSDPSELGLEGFIEPDDEGLPLDELGQAYAALLARGSDPYSAPPAETELAAPAQPLIESVEPPPIDAAVTPRSILEAILFVGHPTSEPLTSERIAALMRGVRPSEIDDLVLELNAAYDASGAPYTIASVDVGYQMQLRPNFAGVRAAFDGRVREARLSQAAIEVLAIVSYQQPVAADQIDRLRGKPSGAILSQLVRRDLLKVEKAATTKTTTYSTTERFLHLFGIDDLGQLPRSHDFDH